jgi:magnesium-transporting ATPase (P-type)
MKQCVCVHKLNHTPERYIQKPLYRKKERERERESQSKRKRNMMSGPTTTNTSTTNGTNMNTSVMAKKIEEAYMSIAEIAAAHPDSHVCVSNVEASLGLSTETAASRLGADGPNLLTPPPRMPEWKRFLLQFKNMFMVLLNVCGVLSVIAFLLQSDKSDKTNLYLAVVLFAVVFLTCFMQFHEEGKAINVMDSFSKMLAVESTVIRDHGKQMTVPVADLVIGDLVIVKDGDKAPADLVLLLCRGLKTECSSLTGESEPVACSDIVSKPSKLIFECKNMVFSSSLCFDGMAIGLVVRTGDNTVRSVCVCVYVCVCECRKSFDLLTKSRKNTLPILIMLYIRRLVRSRGWHPA